MREILLTKRNNKTVVTTIKKQLCSASDDTLTQAEGREPIMNLDSKQSIQIEGSNIKQPRVFGVLCFPVIRVKKPGRFISAARLRFTDLISCLCGKTECRGITTGKGLDFGVSIIFVLFFLLIFAIQNK